MRRRRRPRPRSEYTEEELEDGRYKEDEAQFEAIEHKEEKP